MTEERAEENIAYIDHIPTKSCCMFKRNRSLQSIEEKIRLSEARKNSLKLNLETHEQQTLFCGT